VNRDPIGELGGMNLYGYAGNSPLDFVDPFGESRGCPARPGGAFGGPATPAPWRPFRTETRFGESGEIQRETVYGRGVRWDLKRQRWVEDTRGDICINVFGNQHAPVIPGYAHSLDLLEAWKQKMRLGLFDVEVYRDPQLPRVTVISGGAVRWSFPSHVVNRNAPPREVRLVFPLPRELVYLK